MEPTVDESVSSGNTTRRMTAGTYLAYQDPNMQKSADGTFTLKTRSLMTAIAASQAMTLADAAQSEGSNSGTVHLVIADGVKMTVHICLSSLSPEEKAAFDARCRLDAFKAAA